MAKFRPNKSIRVNIGAPLIFRVFISVSVNVGIRN